MIFSLFKYLLLNTLFIAQGFLLALWLREQYRLHTQEFQEEEQEEPVDSVFPPSVSFPDPEPEEPPTPSPVEPEAAPSPDTQHPKVDELDESLLPNGFKVETVLENMQNVQSPASTTEGESEVSMMVHEPAPDPYAAAADAFDDEDDEGFSTATSPESGPMPTIDYEPTEEFQSDSVTPDGISSLAAEVLGENFDFRSLKGRPSDSAEPEDTEYPVVEAAEVRELGENSYQTEIRFLPETAAVRLSATEQRIEPTYTKELIESLVIEQDRSPGLVHTEDSPPMLARKRKIRNSGTGVRGS